MARFRDVIPETEAGRRQAFWIVAGCIIVALAVLIALRPEESADEEGETSTTVATTTTTTIPDDSPPPLPIGTPMQGIAGQQVTTLPPADARPAALEFLRTWVSFQYEGAPLSSIRAAAGGCLDDIRRQGVNTALAGQSAKLAGIRAERSGAGLVIYAQIDSGSRYGAYPVAFDFAKRNGEWLCTGVLDET